MTDREFQDLVLHFYFEERLSVWSAVRKAREVAQAKDETLAIMQGKKKGIVAEINIGHN